MLFNSPEFLALFLPLAFFLFWLLRDRGAGVQLAGIITISLFFYGYWRIEYLPILLFSLASNFIFSRLIVSSTQRRYRRLFFILGLVSALSVLGYFKYCHFFMVNLSQFLDFSYAGTAREIPIGISFYTFTAIAFLSDVYTRRIDSYTAVEYGATITYFPHLVAGPILFHHDTIPQLRETNTFRLDREKVMLFLFFFSMGLLKKTAFADSLARFADPIFEAVTQGGVPDVGQAWRAAICYTLQLYYDFSGYSDMAIGLGCLFGIRVPVNFYSPYKSRNVSRFWQKWHVSLGYFLRTYLYIPLGGNRLGPSRTLVNLFIVMALCGLWHGAGWTFVLWGVIHGVALVAHRVSGAWMDKAGFRMPSVVAVLITFVFVTFAWVLFRADSIGGAAVIMKAMIGLSDGRLRWIPYANSEIWMGALLVVAWALPNTCQLMQRFSPAILHGREEAFVLQEKWNRLQAGSKSFQFLFGAGTAFALLAGVLFMVVNGESSYLYFDF